MEFVNRLSFFSPAKYLTLSFFVDRLWTMAPFSANNSSNSSSSTAVLMSGFNAASYLDEDAMKRLSLVRTRPSTVMAEEFCQAAPSWRSLPARLDVLVRRLQSWVRMIT
jgi:hypothetical protein